MRTLAIAVILAVLAAGCGGSESDADAAGNDTSTITTAPTTTTTAPTTTTTAPTTTTTAPTTTTTAAAEIPTSPVVPGENEDVDAIVEAYFVVFDNTTTYDEKEPYVTDFEGLEATVEMYEVAGENMGGISLEADEVGIDGTTARVLYSFLFAGNPAYEDLEGDAVLTDAGWQITREFFCEIMTSARVGCP